MRRGIGAMLVVFLLSAMPLSFVGSAVVSVAPVVAGASPLAMVHSGPFAGAVNSTNWAGYAVTGATGSVSYANASWIQPKVTCPKTGTIYLDAFWVGIDGYRSGTVEQTGTLAECLSGVSYYYAWYEFYPSALTLYSSPTVTPGDTFQASVTYGNSTVGFLLSLTDVTTATIATVTGTVSSAARTSAEWIAEAPSSSSGLYPLGNFGTVHFGTDATGQGATNEATIGGVTHAIGKFAHSSIHRINMITNSGTKFKAITSVLTPDGTSFNVTWKRPGP